MSIGLYDDDRARYNHVIFNLELMKLSAYYKNKREIVIMCPEFEPERYSRFIFRKDYNDGIFNKRIFSENIEYGGLAFSNNLYTSLPEEIELTPPDKQLYCKFQNTFNDTAEHKMMFKQMTNFEHARISLDGINIWDKAHIPLKINLNTNGIIFHDYNLASIKDGYEKVKELIELLNPNLAGNRLVGNKFPIQLFNEQDLEKWLSLNPTMNFFNIKYNGFISNEAINFFFSRKNSGIFHQFEYNITYGCKNEEDFIQRRLPLIYMQGLLAMTKNKTIILKYEPDFFEHTEAEKLIRLINYYFNSRRLYVNFIKRNHLQDLGRDFTLYSYVSHNKNFIFKNLPFTKQEVREIFQFIREKNYEVFKMFYEIGSNVELKGGKIIEKL